MDITLGFTKREIRTLNQAVEARSQAALSAKNHSGERDARPSFEVRIQDYARLSRGTLKMATAPAGNVFKRAGVEIHWLGCTPKQGNMDERCHNALPAEARVLRILPPEMTAKLSASGIEFGRAQLTPDASRGTYASIYWTRVKTLAAGRARSLGLGRDNTSTRLKEARILGYVLAHELGHLFGTHHSGAGVMNGPWSPSELAELLRGTLRFQKGEARHIRRRLAGEAPKVAE